jgi:CTP:phosphocholine cytidylyltransferase-like protein
MNAIILAAGIGSRLLPHTLTTPKPLTNVDGIPIIEQQIEFLKEVGIDDIYVVVGYMHEQFRYLQQKYKVKLVYNTEYFNYNNIYSFYLCHEYFGDTWVIEGDVFLRENVFRPTMIHSTIFITIKQIFQQEWEVIFDNNSNLKNIIVHKPLNEQQKAVSSAYVMAGVCYWPQKSAKIIISSLKERISLLLQEKNHAIGNQYWDQIVMDNLNNLDIKIQIIKPDNSIEIDCVSDLVRATRIYGI